MNAHEATHECRPDVLGIGQSLSGTNWLWQQLRSHSGTWMPPIKEMHFLDHGMISAGPRRRLARILARRDKPRPSDEEDLAFLTRYFLSPICEELQREEYRFLAAREHVLSPLPHAPPGEPLSITFRPQSRHFDWYGNLFELAGDRLTGEITPRYCILDRDVIADLRAWAPDLKIIMTVRHPVERLKSYLQKAVRRGHCNEADLVHPDRVLNMTLRNPVQIPFLSPTSNYLTWTEVFDPKDVLVLTLDEIREEPDAACARLCRFLGLNPDPQAFTGEANINTKAERAKCEIPGFVDELLTDALSDELQACARVFGGRASAYPQTAQP